MKRQTERRTARWLDKPGRIEVLSPYPDAKPPAGDPRRRDQISGPGPYEASYDISLGYGHDRSIVLP